MKNPCLLAACLLCACVHVAFLPVFRLDAQQVESAEAFVERMVRDYFRALEAKSLGFIEENYHFENDKARETLLSQFKFVFDMAETKMEQVDVSRVLLHDEPATGVAFAHVEGVLTQSQTGERQRKEHDYAIIVVREKDRWKIAKVMRRGDYDNAVRIAAGADGAADAGPQDDDEHPQSVVGGGAGESSSLLWDDFSEGTTQWDHAGFDVNAQGGKLLWNDPAHRSLSSKVEIPIEDVVIEFDARCATDGLPVRWYNEKSEGYCIVLGSRRNTRSVSEFGRIGANAKYVMGKHIEFGKWQHYKIVRYNDVLEACVDGEVVISRRIPARIEGKGSLRFYSYTDVALDNVRVRPAHARNALREPTRRGGTF